MYDVIIIGAGPAGLSAALYTSRANLSTLVMGKDKGALEKVEKIENYFGLPFPVSGGELVENARKQAQGLGAELLEDEVLGISWNGTFQVACREREYEAAAVIVATGASRTKGKIPGLTEHEGAGVSYCAICDGFFYRGKDVAVLGHGEYALHELGQLLPVVGSAILCTNGQEPEGQVPEGVRVERTAVTSIEGESLVEAITFADGSRAAVSGVFVALGSAGAVDLARKIGVQVEKNTISVNEKMATNVPGLFAAGDCIGGLLQISTAVGEGAQAGMSAIAYVRRNFRQSPELKTAEV